MFIKIGLQIILKIYRTVMKIMMKKIMCMIIIKSVILCNVHDVVKMCTYLQCDYLKQILDIAL